MKITVDDLKEYINKVGIDTFLSEITEFDYRLIEKDGKIYYRCSIVSEQTLKVKHEIDAGVFYCPYIPECFKEEIK